MLDNIDACQEAVDATASWSILPVEPDILEAPAVVDAVDLDDQALDLRPPASGGLAVENDRPRDLFLQLAVDVVDHLQPFFEIRFLRLGLEKLGHRRVAVIVVVARRAAGVVLEEVLV